MIAKPPPPEFSRIVPVDRLGGRPVTETLNASADELARLALRFNLVALDRLCATVQLERQPASDIIHVEGRLEADVVQTCVVKLTPFPSHVEDSFELDFAPVARLDAHVVDVDLDADPPEPIENGVIDIGELVAQYLSLALDPHPRSPGAALESDWSEIEAEPRPSPFDTLRSLKSRQVPSG